MLEQVELPNNTIMGSNNGIGDMNINTMETTDAANLDVDPPRPSKRIRSPPRTYYESQLENELTMEEERMLAQAIANSRTDQRREPLTDIPFGPTFYPTIEEFSGDPLEYLETIRPEAEKYGEFVIRMHIVLQYHLALMPDSILTTITL